MSMSPDNAVSAQPESLLAPRVRHAPYAVVFLASFAMLLALLSYDDRDSAFLAGGMGDMEIIRNWMGYIGAYVARFLLLVLGFGAYAGVLLLLVTFGRRAMGGSRLRPAGWDYWLALMLFVLGATMFFGSWPDLLGDLATGLNIAMTTGGVVGQRLCDPENGWMQVILNPTGNRLVALTLVLVALAVIWLYDWQDLLWGKRRAGAVGPELDAEDGDRPVDSGVVEGAASEPARRLVARTKPATAAREADDASPARLEAKPVAAAAEAPRVKPVPAAPAAGTPRPVTAAGPIKLPSLDLLSKRDDRETTVGPEELKAKQELIQKTLDSFQIDAKVGEATCGPRVTLFEVCPAPGVKVERISNISNNLAMELRAVSLRILTPIPGKNTVGLEVPNATSATVGLRGLMETPAWRNSTAKIPVLLGRNISGAAIVLDLAKAPHLLIAGATGSGKSVSMNALIMSLLYRFTSEELRLIMVDPKVVEFHAYESLPHLLAPVITDVKKVPLALRYAIKEMERRYRVLAKVNARNLEGFNDRPPAAAPVVDDEGKTIPARLPYIVIIIDELADIMMTAKAEVETSLARIAQLSRAVGIHCVVATQRPSVNVITGTIKANFPTRIAFQVTSQVDSRTILDGKGAESLLGRGDMLFKPPGASKLERNQSAFVEDEEIDRVVHFVAAQAPQQFDPDVFKVPAGAADGGAGGDNPDIKEMDEELIQKATDVIVRDRRPTISYVQRCLGIGYNRAALIMEILEQRGVVGPQVGTGAREILITAEDRASSVPLDDGLPDDGDDTLGGPVR